MKQLHGMLRWQMNRNKRCRNPFNPFRIQVMFSVFRGLKYDDIKSNHATTTKTHLRPWIDTAIFSENSKLSKSRFSENFHTRVSTDHQVQFLNGFAIFHKAQHTHGLWKISKKPNSLVKYCCGTYCVKV